MTDDPIHEPMHDPIDEMKSATQAEVWLRDQKVGILIRYSDKNFVFKYDDPYVENKNAIPIGVAFPLKKGEFSSPFLHPFFDNLIMEGWLLNQAEKKFHVDKRNRWSLLMLTGTSLLGAVSVHALNGSGKLMTDKLEFTKIETKSFPIKIASQSGICSFCLNPVRESNLFHQYCYKKLWGTSKALFINLEEAQPLQSFSKTIEDGSISGAQRKGLFSLKSSELMIKSDDSSYILKPDGDYPELPANEHLTMTVARHLNFDVPPTGLIEVENCGLIFVIQRFDRVKSNYKLLFEDMAQIYEEASENKYSLSHEKVGQAILRNTQAGPLNLIDYFRRILFCFLTANGDMHLKNWSLLEMEKNPGIYRLSPVYDWLNTRIALPRERDDLAIPLGGKLRNMQKSYFNRFAVGELKLNEIQVERIFSEIPTWIQTLKKLIPHSFLSEKMKKAYLRIIEERFALF